MKPLIGITAGALLHDGVEKASVNRSYIELILANGGIPFVIPASFTNIDEIGIVLEHVDGVLVTGGPDIDPALYGEEPGRGIGDFYPQRDRYEIELIKRALEVGRPVFGICRGLQLMNVAFGGTLYQDLNSEPHVWIQHNQRSDRSVLTHSVTVSEGRLRSVCGSTSLRVNSLHHQAVKETAPCFDVSAVSPDGVIEALEYVGTQGVHATGDAFGKGGATAYMLGVQWHIEEIWREQAMRPIILDFIDACLRRQ